MNHGGGWVGGERRRSREEKGQGVLGGGAGPGPGPEICFFSLKPSNCKFHTD